MKIVVLVARVMSAAQWSKSFSTGRRSAVAVPEAARSFEVATRASRSRFGDLLDPVSVEKAMKRVDKLFLLSGTLCSCGEFRQAFSECEPKGTEVPLPIMPSCLRSRIAKAETWTSHKRAQTERQKLPDAFGGNKRHQKNHSRVGAFVNQIDRRFPNFDRWEEQMRGKAPSWTAFDLRMMLQGYFDRGFASAETEVKRPKKALGHPPRTYVDFATETDTLWNA